jgi:hypothetical protein
MNTLRKPLTRERNFSEAGSRPDIAVRPRVLPAVSVEYDDGDPATIVPMARTPEAAAIRRDRIGPERAAGDASGRRSGLAAVAREAAVDYDDGNPATIAG